MNPLDLPDRIAPLLDDDLDLARITALARADGGRLRRRRRAAAGVAVLAVAAVAALAVGAEVSWTGHDDRATFADRSPAPFDPQDPGPVTTPTGAGLAAALRWSVAQVSDGGTGGYEGGVGLVVGRLRPSRYVTGDYAVLRLDLPDGVGPATVAVNVQLDAGPVLDCSQLDTTRASDRLRDALTTKSDCRTRSLPDGSVLTTYEMSTVEDVATGATDARRVVDLLRPDGVRMVAEATNGYDPVDGGVSQLTVGEDGVLSPAVMSADWRAPRTEPVLDVAELRRIADQPFWGATLPQHFVDEGASLPTFDELAPSPEPS